MERGQFVKAYQDAKALVDRHPEKASAHFALSYVLRYGGAIEESARECDTALALDPGNYAFRSCVFTFEQLGNYAARREFLQLDSGSAWAASNMIRLYIRDGKLAPARDLAEKFRDQQWGAVMLACVDHPGSENAAKLAQQEAAGVFADPDPEVHYVVASDMLFCGQKELALRMIKSSIDGHFCPYEGLRNDSIWEKLRSRAGVQRTARWGEEVPGGFSGAAGRGSTLSTLHRVDELADGRGDVTNDLPSPEFRALRSVLHPR